MISKETLVQNLVTNYFNLRSYTLQDLETFSQSFNDCIVRKEIPNSGFVQRIFIVSSRLKFLLSKPHCTIIIYQPKK